MSKTTDAPESMKILSEMYKTPAFLIEPSQIDSF